MLSGAHSLPPVWRSSSQSAYGATSVLNAIASSTGGCPGAGNVLVRAAYLCRIARLPAGLGQGVYTALRYEAAENRAPERNAILRQAPLRPSDATLAPPAGQDRTTVPPGCTQEVRDGKTRKRKFEPSGSRSGFPGNTAPSRRRSETRRRSISRRTGIGNGAAVPSVHPMRTGPMPWTKSSSTARGRPRRRSRRDRLSGTRRAVPR
jgi:hypothetical protein